MSPPSPDADASADRNETVHRVVREYFRYRSHGDDVSEESIVARHPELAPDLQQELHKAKRIHDAADQAADERLTGLLDALEARDDDDDAPDSSVPTDAPDRPGGRQRKIDIRMTMDESGIISDIRATQAPVETSDEGSDAATASTGSVASVVRRAPGELVGGKARRFRPISRPPMAALNIVDDSQTSGEWVRIRGSSCAIGRTQGDVVIPHEVQMSGRHAEIRLQLEHEGFRWYLIDLDSTNGSFVRVDRIRLKDGNTVLIGSRRFRFQAAAEEGGGSRNRAALVELTSSGSGGSCIFLQDEERWLGRDPFVCPRFLWDDPLLDQKHARLYPDSAGRWCLEDAHSLNGVWARVGQVQLTHGCWFQLGEQRFRFFIP